MSTSPFLSVFCSLLRWFDLFAKSVLQLLTAEKPLEGFHIVVDAGNGAGGFFAVSFLLQSYFVFILLILGVRLYSKPII